MNIERARRRDTVRQFIDTDEPDTGIGDGLILSGVEVPAIHQQNLTVRQLFQPYTFDDRLLPPPGEHGKRHATQKAGGSRFPRVEVPVSIEEDERRVDALPLQPGKDSYRADAIPGIDHRSI